MLNIGFFVFLSNFLILLVTIGVSINIFKAEPSSNKAIPPPPKLLFEEDISKLLGTVP